jgi:N-formylglutamate amidohydrolase
MDKNKKDCTHFYVKIDKTMLILIFFFIGFISSKSIPSRFYFSGYQNSFKAIQLHRSNINIILSAPHAGSDMPNDIPDRTIGGCQRNNSNKCIFYFNDTCSDGNRCPTTTVQDFADFDPFTERVADELYSRYNILPFVIIAKWNRKKIDFNREINEATFNHPKAMKSYSKYHSYLQKAVKKIEQKFNGKGLLLDIHQHAQGK